MHPNLRVIRSGIFASVWRDGFLGPEPCSASSISMPLFIVFVAVVAKREKRMMDSWPRAGRGGTTDKSRLGSWYSLVRSRLTLSHVWVCLSVLSSVVSLFFVFLPPLYCCRVHLNLIVQWMPDLSVPGLLVSRQAFFLPTPPRLCLPRAVRLSTS